MCEVVILEKSQLEELLRQAGTIAASIVLEQTHKSNLEIMTKKELANYLRCDISKINRMMKIDLPFNICEKTLRKYVIEYKIPHIKLGRDLRFNAPKVETFLEKLAEDNQKSRDISTWSVSKRKRSITPEPINPRKDFFERELGLK